MQAPHYFEELMRSGLRQFAASARGITAMACIVTVSGCYHATVITGAKPSTTTIKQEWASSWVYGLVPPKTVETAAKCPNGVAQVETQLPFVNMLVGILTLGIYTPMSIVATCAEKSAALQGESVATPAGQISAADLQETFEQAATRATETGKPVLVDMSASTLVVAH